MVASDTDIVQNRSEIVFLYDAVDANPNGNPMSGANRPRIDPETGEAIVTDVRLKRYLRDQLDEDDHGVYIRSVKSDDGNQYRREDLLADRLRDLDPDEWDLDNVEDDESLRQDLVDEIYGEFIQNSVDVRYFGATMSVDMQGRYEGFADYLPDHFTGPVQFSPGKTLHEVSENEEYNSLTSVIATGDDKEQGGFDLDDHRIQYGLIRFHGLVDENGATDTRLTTDDVERLDTLCWRSIKNQTLSRSKVGQEPRLYLRVEYDTKSFHLGDLHLRIDLDDESEDPEKLRTIKDVTLNVDELIDRLSTHADRIDTVHVLASDAIEVSYGGDTGRADYLYDALRDAVGDDAAHVIDVYDEYEATLPTED